MPKRWREETRQADVLVVGGGIAACCAAIEAAKFGVKVLLADKGRLGTSGSTPTSGGAVALFRTGEGDDLEKFSEDTHSGGEEMGDPALVGILCEEIGPGVGWLEHMGILFQRQADGNLHLQKSLGHRYPRSCVALGDGAGLMRGLRKEVLHRGVTVGEQLWITGLVVENGEISGAYGVDLAAGTPVHFAVKSVCLCAGSATGLYPIASANFLTTGDSFAMALEAGAELANMEFVEFTVVPAPNGLPISMGGATPFPSRGGRLFNSLGERFMERYDPENRERTRRNTLVRAIYCENEEGRGPVIMDASYIPQELRARFDAMHHMVKLRAAGVDPWKDRFEWVPSVHSLLGGMVIDREGQSNVPGLFAAGEASTGIHGANRLSGNALGEGIVFGFRAGRAAARRAIERRGLKGTTPGAGSEKRSSAVEAQRAKIRQFIDKPAADPRELKREILRTAWSRLGVRREGHLLQEASRLLEAVSDELNRSGVPDLRGACELLELSNLSLVGRAVAAAALTRRETRGQHWRSDFEERQETWRKWIVLSKTQDGLATELRGVGYLNL
ncbi:MAG: FAD-dependent oxidoreductase [Firmicutes bacterium]|nr:FAD-dependent oxidoreductase [Bacillota bacterium]